MKMSKMFMPTLKEIPADAEITSHQLMVRSGMIKKMTSGVYNQLPMGLRVFKKIEQIIREIKKIVKKYFVQPYFLLNYGKSLEGGLLWVKKCLD